MRYSAKTIFYFNKLGKQVKIGKNRALYRVAGLIRIATKRSMRLAAGPSRPGSPPHAHKASGLRSIQFSVHGNSAIVGPIKFPGSNFWDEPVPHIHEFGGNYISRRGFMGDYPKRSYMATTLERLIRSGRLPREFRVSIAEVLQ